MKKLVQLSVFILLFTTVSFGQVGSVPCWREISAGQNFTLAIKGDGTLWGWGLNGNQLGLGFSGNQNLPIQIGVANDWATVSAGDNHSLAVKTNGTLWAWGSGLFGQLGNGSFNNATWTVTQVGTATDWFKVSSGTQFSLAIKTNGTLWSWGLNNLGQLGNGTIINTNLPNQVGTATNWSKIDAGNQHSLAIDSSGVLYGWGDNTFGQLGNGTNISSLSPIILSTLNNWMEISAGYDHSMILNTNGFLFTAGNNANGQLCYGNNTSSNTFLPGTFGGVQYFYIKISAGNGHSMAVKNDNTLWTSGLNNYGQLGLGIVSNTNILTQVGTSNTWFLISAGYIHSQALEFTSNLWSAGRGLEGQLAVGSYTNSNTIVLVNCPTTLSKSNFSANNLELSLAPNPTSGMVNINYNLQNFEKINFRITNIQGQLIYEMKVEASIGFQTQNLDLSFQTNGLYFLTMSSDSGSVVLKILKN